MPNVVDITVRANDQTKAGYDSATHGAERLGEAAEGVKGKIKGIALAGGALAGAGVGLFLKDSISAASDLNETMSKSSVIFGKNADDIAAWGSKAADNLGLSKEAAVSAAAGFGDMFLQLGIGQDQSTKMSKQVVQLAADLGSFSNLDTADVTERISGALRGEYDSLQAVIPNISAARVETEALAETHKKSAAELTAAEKATATLAIIQKDGARATGDFARTSTGLANSQKIMTAKLEDAKAKIGTALLPIMAKLTQLISNYLVPALLKTVAVLGTVGKWVVQNKAWLGPLVVAILAVVLALKIWAAAQIVLNVILTANPIGVIIVAVAALALGIYMLVKNFKQISDFLGGKWGTIISAAIAVIFPFIGIPMLIIGHWQMLWDFLKSLWAGIVSGFNTVVGFITAIPGRIAAVASSMFQSVKDAATSAVKWVSDKVDAIIKFFTDLGGNIAKGVAGAFNAVGAAFQWLYDHSIGPILDAINKINSFFNQQVSGHGSPAPGALAKAQQMYGNQLGNAGHEPSTKGPGRAYGGSVTAGVTYPVGERGTEWFTPATNGRVTPQSGGSGRLVLSFAGGTDSAVAQLIMSLIRSGQITLQAA